MEKELFELIKEHVINTKENKVITNNELFTIINSLYRKQEIDEAQFTELLTIASNTKEFVLMLENDKNYLIMHSGDVYYCISMWRWYSYNKEFFNGDLSIRPHL